MLTLIQNKTLDALEYALRLIEEYDKEFKQKLSKDGKEEKKKEDQGESVQIASRFDDVKASYQTLFILQKERAQNFVTNTQVYKLADEKIDFNEKFERSRKFTSSVYDCLNTQIIVPIHDNVTFIYDTSLKKASLIIDNIHNSPLSQILIQKYTNAKVTLTKNWLKLDLNNDGKVTMSDILDGLNSIKQILAEYEIVKNAIELPQTLRQKAL